MYLPPALRLDILARDASEIRNMGDTVHHHKRSHGDKIKQRCKSHESTMTYETTVKTVIPWLSQHAKCLTRRMFTFLTQQKPHLLERASNEYGKSIRCAAEHASDQFQKSVLAIIKKNSCCNGNVKVLGKKIHFEALFLLQQRRKLKITLFEIRYLIYLYGTELET